MIWIKLKNIYLKEKIIFVEDAAESKQDKINFQELLVI